MAQVQKCIPGSNLFLTNLKQLQEDAKAAVNTERSFEMPFQPPVKDSDTNPFNFQKNSLIPGSYARWHPTPRVTAIILNGLYNFGHCSPYTEPDWLFPCRRNGCFLCEDFKSGHKTAYWAQKQQSLQKNQTIFLQGLLQLCICYLLNIQQDTSGMPAKL